jgi:hypothetical protein
VSKYQLSVFSSLFMPVCSTFSMQRSLSSPKLSQRYACVLLDSYVMIPLTEARTESCTAPVWKLLARTTGGVLSGADVPTADVTIAFHKWCLHTCALQRVVSMPAATVTPVCGGSGNVPSGKHSYRGCMGEGRARKTHKDTDNFLSR